MITEESISKIKTSEEKKKEKKEEKVKKAEKTDVVEEKKQVIEESVEIEEATTAATAPVKVCDSLQVTGMEKNAGRNHEVYLLKHVIYIIRWVSKGQKISTNSKVSISYCGETGGWPVLSLWYILKE